MVEGIPAFGLDIGAAGLLTLGVILVLTGKLVWHKLVDKMVADLTKRLDEAIEASREQREINRHLVETNHVLAEALENIAEGQDVIVTLIRAGLPAPRGDDKP